MQVQNVTSLAQRRNMGTSNGIIDSVLLEAGQPGGDIAGENIVYLEVGVDWTSSRSKVRAGRGGGGSKVFIFIFGRSMVELCGSRADPGDPVP